MSSHSISLLCASAILLLAIPPASAAEPPSLEALRIEQTITLDGLLDEPAWAEAKVSTGFTQRQPEEFELATEQTTVRVVYTADTLYVGVEAFDSEPEKIVGQEMGRDAQLFRDDGIVLLLDTFHDRRNAYFFETNPNSSRTDGYITDEGRDFSIDWDGIWDVRSRRHAKGWTAEFAIPFRTMRFDPAQTTWGLQVRRIIVRKSEITFWSPIGRDASLFRLSQAGTLTGLEGLNTGRNLRVKPYVSASRREPRDGSGPTKEDSEVGLDVKWGITQGLALDLTVNTDFAETEVDEQQVNLSRFSLFFPEKREFFLENAGIFEFGPDIGPELKVFFSRRIGLAQGQPVDLELGARLAGRQGPWSIGLLGARTGDLAADPDNDRDAVPTTDWGTIRLKRNLGERSNLGLIVTHRDDGKGSANRVYGVDGQWKPTDRLDFWAFGAASDGETEDEQGWAGGIGGGYQGSFWSGGLRILDIENSFDPKLGFVLRPGRRSTSGRLGWNPRPKLRGVRNLSFEFEADIYEKDGTTETSIVSVDYFGMDFLSGESIVAWVTDIKERLFEPFEIYPGVTLPSGEYRWRETGIWGRTNDGRKLAANGWVLWGDFFEGERWVYNLTLRWRPSRYFRVETQWQHNDVSLDAGDFETNLLRQRLSFSLNPNLTLDGLVQYNDAAEQLTANLRFNWHYRPGSDLFVVYNHGWDAPGGLDDLGEHERQVIVKLTYSWDS